MKNIANGRAISKTITMGAYCVLVCAAVTFSFKTMFYSLMGAVGTVEQDNLISRETLSKSNAGLNSDDIVKIQMTLDSLGYEIDEIDGILGVKTQEALVKFQAAHGLPANGIIEPQTLNLLFTEYAFLDVPQN